MRNVPIIPFALFSLVAGGTLRGQAPAPVLAYQGRLLEATLPVTGTRTFVFSLLDASGRELWTSGNQSVSVNTGLYGVVLGASPMSAIPTSVLAQPSLKLHVVVSGIALAPDTDLVPALQARSAFEVSGDFAGDIGGTQNAITLLRLQGIPLDLTTTPPTANQGLVYNGTKWIAGAIGGSTGPKGDTGATGAAGATGATGAQGPIGATGVQGPVGATGATGAQGLVGATGATGTQGLVGATGATGTQGLVGATGATGTQGLVGATGATGIQGLAGATGATGIQGLAGATGATGAQGLVGATGATGTQGLAGATGATGVQGLLGPAGATGASGAPGTAGVQGATGAVGTNGLDGKTLLNGTTAPLAVIGAKDDFYLNTANSTLSGPKGAVTAGQWPAAGTSLVGSQGPAGATGFTGATGPAGPQGPSGTTGATGATGPAGATGTQGPAGPAGGSMPWVSATADTTAASNTGYLANSNTALVTFTLPATPAVGDVFKISGAGVGGWKIAQNAGQSIITKDLLGNIGKAWSDASNSAMNWAAIASSADGMVVLGAGRNNELLQVSIDSGLTWARRDTMRNWTSAAVTPGGSPLFAGTATGSIFSSWDKGTTWNLTDTLPGPVASLAIGHPGFATTPYLLVAAVAGGKVYTSDSWGGSGTWVAHATNGNWSTVACSADGMFIVAAAYNGGMYRSYDFGVTWARMPLWPAVNRTWTSVALSSDGSKIVAVEEAYLYISNDYGTTWTTPEPYATRMYKAVASSADGSRLVAVVDAGAIYVSINSGITWVPWTDTTGGAVNWSSVTMSADGQKIYVSNTSYGAKSSPTHAARTTTGTVGSISGGQYDTIDLQYIGNNTFMKMNHSGYLRVE